MSSTLGHPPSPVPLAVLFLDVCLVFGAKSTPCESLIALAYQEELCEKLKCHCKRQKFIQTGLKYFLLAVIEGSYYPMTRRGLETG